MRRLIGSKDVSVIRKLSNSRQLDVFFARFSSIYLARLLLFFFYFDDREVTQSDPHANSRSNVGGFLEILGRGGNLMAG